MESLKRKLIVVGRAPLKGRAKTRLAAEVGEDWAHRFYLAMLEDFFTNLAAQQDCFEEIILAVDPLTTQSGNKFEDLVIRHQIQRISIVDQPGEGLFSKLSNLLEKYCATDVLVHLTGTDVPNLNFRNICQLTQSSNSYLGPDKDGGFYYGIFKKNAIHTFNEFSPSSSNKVYNELMERNSSLRPLELWQDLDQLADIKKVCHLANGPEHLSFILKSYELEQKRLLSRRESGA